MTEFRPRCVLVTGGAGFIGVNFVRWVLERDPEVAVVNLDALTYAGNLESLADVFARHGPGGDGRHFFIRADVRDFETLRRVLCGEAHETPHGSARPRPIPAPDAVVHLAAESHVDRSIMGPAAFVETNVRGTMALLEACRAALAGRERPFRLVQVSTDEVYGSLGPDDSAFTEAAPLAPNSPYSASKAGADLLVRAYVETFRLPAVITRCSNNYGPYQFPEKLIPLMITRALADEALPVYGDGCNVRDWLYVTDHAAALWAVLCRGRAGEVYNIGGQAERQNLDVVRALLRLLGKPESLIRFVADRPGHDRRYAMDTTKLTGELGWRPAHSFEAGLAQTVQWYLEHRSWWERVLTEAYRATSAMYLKD
ncbi:MAG TPA: dTDP-glucose 4,6-dehydratase [Gemmatimonadales bacterium]|jgi:dTDP-glucose 4,6-dehydratase|nr:dTDP-glucose 4,6-dehydratase [Gemmatimonadales bacterium]